DDAGNKREARAVGPNGVNEALGGADVRLHTAAYGIGECSGRPHNQVDRAEAEGAIVGIGLDAEASWGGRCGFIHFKGARCYRTPVVEGIPTTHRDNVVTL